jgi:hypothetical protein
MLEESKGSSARRISTMKASFDSNADKWIASDQGSREFLVIDHIERSWPN